MLKVLYHPSFRHHVPEGHRFPMEKYELLPEQLLYEGTLTASHFVEAQLPNMQDILQVHDAQYVDKLIHLQLDRKAQRDSGFEHNQGLVQRELRIAQASIQAALFALQDGVSFSLAGGTHHAFANRGEGFCLLNDIAVGASYLLRHTSCKKIMVVDLDVHQGNGTASIFQEEAQVFTLSLHGKNNYPLRKEKSTLDVPLEDYTNDATYLSVLDTVLKREMDAFQPDFVFFQAGVDILQSDKLGKLSVSMQGCKARDRMLFELCKANAVPVAVSMGGGYSPKIADIVEAHANAYRLAQEIFF